MGKPRYIISPLFPEPETDGVLCGNIEQLMIKPINIIEYDYDKNEEGVFITDLTGDLEYDSVDDLIDSFYRLEEYPPIVQYGLVSKEEFDRAMKLRFPLMSFELFGKNKED